ncbi:MAG: class I SAM-dependent methyltransferase [Pseudomonadota bacterium]
MQKKFLIDGVPDGCIWEYPDPSTFKPKWTENIVSVHVSERIPIWLKIFAKKFSDNPINMLEIGVFKGGWASHISASKTNVASFTGVDPYLGDDTDPYTGAYWSNKQGAQSIFENTSQLFGKLGYTLDRSTSLDFVKRHEHKPAYDAIFIDGDHRFEACLTDARICWPLLKPDGLMMFDDYANSDHPGVTKAVTQFISEKEEEIESLLYFGCFFTNLNKAIPVLNGQVAITKKAN